MDDSAPWKTEETVVRLPRLLVGVSFSFSCIFQIWWLSPFLSLDRSTTQRTATSSRRGADSRFAFGSPSAWRHNPPQERAEEWSTESCWPPRRQGGGYRQRSSRCRGIRGRQRHRTCRRQRRIGGPCRRMPRRLCAVPRGDLEACRAWLGLRNPYTSTETENGP